MNEAVCVYADVEEKFTTEGQELFFHHLNTFQMFNFCPSAIDVLNATNTAKKTSVSFISNAEYRWISPMHQKEYVLKCLHAFCNHSELHH